MSIDARDIAEAISAMEAARVFMEANCEVGGGRIQYMINLENSARTLKFGLQDMKIKVTSPESA